MHLRDFLSDREQRGHRPERPAHVILIETGGDDANSCVRELHADIDDTGIEELHLVNADDLHSNLDAREKVGAAGHRNRFEPAIIARDDVLAGEAVVDEGFENLHALSCDHCAP